MERRLSWLLLGSLLEVACAEGLSAGRDPIDHTDTDTEMDDDTSDEGVGDDSSEDTGTGEDSSGSSDSDSSGSGDDSDSTDDTGGSSGDGSDSGSSDGDSSDGDSSEGGSSDSGDDSGGDSTEDDGSTSDSGGSETDGGSSEDGSGTEGGSEADDASSEDGSDGEGSDSGSTDGTGTDTECDPGFADCDEEPGCETDVSGGDLDHCGTCDKSCNLAGASEASCMAGTCTVRFVVPITGDSYTNSADTGENNGDYQAVWVDGGPDVFTAYLQAAMPTVPDGATVSEGNLITMCYEGGGDVTARRILAVWDEATITAANAPSVDMANALDTQTPTGSFGAPDPVIFDVAAAIQQWLDGTANHGVALFGSGTDGSSHHSSEASSASNRPEYDFTVIY